MGYHYLDILLTMHVRNDREGLMAKGAHIKTFAALVCFGLIWACSSVVTNAAASIELGASWYASSVCGTMGAVLVGLALALNAERLFPLAERRRATAAAGVAGIVSTVLIILLAYHPGTIPTSLSIIALLLVAVAEAAFAYLTCAWFEIYARLDPLHSVLSLCIAHMLSALLGWVFIGLVGGPVAKSIVTAATLGICLAAYAWCRSHLDDALFSRGETTLPGWSFPTKPVMLVSMFALASYYVRCGVGDGAAAFPRLGVAFACICMFAVYWIHYERMNLNLVADLSLLMAIAALLMRFFTVAPIDLVSGVVGSCAYGIFYVFVNAMLCRLAYRYGVNPLLLFGSTYAAIKVANMVGRVCGDTAFACGQTAFLAGAAVLIVLLVAVFLASASPSSLLENWGLETNEGAGGSDGIGEPDQTSQRDALIAICSRLAARYGLTRREEEMLGLLAQNLSDADIQERLCVSRATVRTHIQHVYEKLGVHSKQEVVALVEAA